MSARIVPIKKAPAKPVFPALELLKARNFNLEPATRSSDRMGKGDLVLGEKND